MREPPIRDCSIRSRSASLPSRAEAAVVLERQPSALADVAKVRGDGRHAATFASDLDHHLRRPPNHGGLNALTQHLPAVMQRR
jgi:hypothetical protein